MMEEHQANLTFTLGGGKNEKEVYESQVREADTRTWGVATQTQAATQKNCAATPT
jgi:hypothetical protein